MQRVLLPLLGAGLFLGCAENGAAGIIISIVGPSTLPGTSSIGPVGATPAPNNDNSVAASPNTIPYSIFWNSLIVAEVEYAVANSGGATEYYITQNVVNLTGQAWMGFQFDLGFGRGANFVAAAGLLDFDLPDADPAPFSSRFSTVNHQPRRITWSGGSAPNFNSVQFSFSIDVPDNLAALHPGGISTFTLRQMPLTEAAAIPEPAAGALMGSGLLAALAIRKRGAGMRWLKRQSQRLP